MCLALPVWRGRVSPLFDTARVFEIVAGDPARSTRVRVPRWVSGPVARARLLSSVEVTRVICGAISAPYLAALEAEGVEVTAFRAGLVGEVLAAYARGDQHLVHLCMPGCGRRRR